jgi:succinate dehydrogenase hydrophobic anchor subunit
MGLLDSVSGVFITVLIFALISGLSYFFVLRKVKHKSTWESIWGVIKLFFIIVFFPLWIIWKVLGHGKKGMGSIMDYTKKKGDRFWNSLQKDAADAAEDESVEDQLKDALAREKEVLAGAKKVIEDPTAPAEAKVGATVAAVKSDQNMLDAEEASLKDELARIHDERGRIQAEIDQAKAELDADDKLEKKEIKLMEVLGREHKSLDAANGLRQSVEKHKTILQDSLAFESKISDQDKQLEETIKARLKLLESRRKIVKDIGELFKEGILNAEKEPQVREKFAELESTRAQAEALGNEANNLVKLRAQALKNLLARQVAAKEVIAQMRQSYTTLLSQAETLERETGDDAAAEAAK